MYRMSLQIARMLIRQAFRKVGWSLDNIDNLARPMAINRGRRLFTISGVRKEKRLLEDYTNRAA